MGEVPDEDTGLPSEARLWRRVPPAEQLPPVGDGLPMEPKGSAFRTKGTEDGVSVGVGEYFAARGEGPEAMLAVDGCDSTWGVLEVTVGQVRDIGFEVEVDETDPGHALIKPPPSSGKSRKISKQLAVWVVPPQWP